MALRFGFPTTDNLLCSHIVCREKADTILHFKDGKEQLFCSDHYPVTMVGDERVARLEKLRRSGERNTPRKPTSGEA